MKLLAFIALILGVLLATAESHYQVILNAADSTNVLATTVPFIFPLPNPPGAVADGNVTITISSNGTLSVYGIIDIPGRAAIISRKLGSQTPIGNTGAIEVISHTIRDLDPAINSLPGVTVPIILPILNEDPGVGNCTIAVLSNSTLRITTIVANSNRNFQFYTPLSVTKAPTASKPVNILNWDERVDTSAEAGINIGPEKIDVTINGVGANTAVDIF